MDFVRILRSLEELLYELMTWIVLYPRTLWRSAMSPLEMLRYSQREVADSLDQQSVAFAIFALVYASQQLRCEGQMLDRNTLRRPFFGQCDLAAVFAFTLGLSSIMLRRDRDWVRSLGGVIAVASVSWYVIVQARWLREYHNAGGWSAGGRSVWSFVKASAIVLTAALVLSWVR